MADYRHQLLVRPDIGLQRGNVEVAHRDHRNAALPLCPEPSRDLVKKLQLMGELWVRVRVRNIAARRHIDIMELDTAWQFDHGMPTIGAAAPGFSSSRCERRARQ